MSDDAPSSWFVWSNNPELKPKSYTLQVCHADMRYTPKGYDYLVTGVPKVDKVSLAYLRMLIHGPFKSVSDLISLVKVKDQFYLQCSDLEKWPAPLIFNFCVASRAPIEFENQLNHWWALVQEGYPEVLGFLLSHSCGGKNFKYERTFPESGHHWFDPQSDWKRIMEGNPDLTGYRYDKYPASVTPSNVIWGVSEDYKIISKLDNLKAAEYFDFKFPPPRPKVKPRDPNEIKWKNAYWDPEAIPPVGLAPGAMQAAMNQLNQIQMQHAPDGAWAQVHNAIHDEVAVAQPVAPPQPFVHHDDDFPEHDDFPDFHDEDLDD